jgi:serine/threonine protein phosphatase PrpC
LNCTLASETRIGARLVNQDRLGHWRTERALLMVVADGLGGHPRGELAAQISVDHFAAAFQRDARPVLADPREFLVRAMTGAHAAILREAYKLDLPDVPRTVIVACVVQDGHAYWAHIGDCRLYLVRNGRIAVQTRDHTVVQHLVDAGRIAEDAVATHPERNRILQCLGGYQAPRPDPVAQARLARNDLLVLCSDGLWGPLTQRQLLHSFATLPLGEALGDLALLAEQRSGPQCDNVSVLAMSWGDDEVGPEDEPDTIRLCDLPTDIQDFTATDPDFLRMSDEDIEKAIAEIKTALRKSAQ